MWQSPSQCTSAVPLDLLTYIRHTCSPLVQSLVGKDEPKVNWRCGYCSWEGETAVDRDVTHVTIAPGRELAGQPNSIQSQVVQLDPGQFCCLFLTGPGQCGMKSGWHFWVMFAVILKVLYNIELETVLSQYFRAWNVFPIMRVASPHCSIHYRHRLWHDPSFSQL